MRRPARACSAGWRRFRGANGATEPDRRSIGTVRHVFTHFSLDLHIVPRRAAREGWWQPLDRLGEAGLPTLYRRAAELAL